MKTLLVTFLTILLLAPASLQAQDKAEAPKKTAIENISAEKFDTLRKSDTNKIVVLDVRTKEEYSKARIPGSVLIDFNSDDFEKQVAKLDKNKTYLVHCAGGGRSARACKKMDQLGFQKLYNLEGGMGAWEKAGKPVEK
jgi:rhodanese-related sulfurtransferase